MSIKTGPFFYSDFLLHHYSDFWYYRSLLYYGKFKKKSGENKNKLRTTYPQNHENFKNNNPRAQLYWFLWKKEYKELRFWIFLTQAASSDFIRAFQTFVSMNIWLNAFKNTNYFMINSLWHWKNLNKSLAFKTRPDIGETFKRTKDYLKKS